MKTDLPIDEHLQKIVDLATQDRPLVLTATPGSGKTTRFPPALLRHLQSVQKTQKIIVIVPKRLAAVAACDRICSENNWTVGEQVGYQVRFESVYKPSTQLIFMTEGTFLKKIQNSLFFDEVGYLILDEFHERSAAIDMILGLGFEKKLLEQNLQIIVMSATLNVEPLKKYFGDSNCYDVEQKPYPLHLFYQKKNQNLNCDTAFFEHLKLTVIEAVKKSKKDILVFLPGFREIQKAKNILQPLFSQFPIECIYGQLNLTEQKRILNKTNPNRRIVLATNVAESSLTLPDLDCVIDSGLEKTLVFERKMGFSRLETKRISLFSAQQRAGRAARTQEGFCFRMWHETDQLSMAAQKKPEILNSSLIEENLLLLSMGYKNPTQFSWLDWPSKNNIENSLNKLKNWNLITPELEITETGKRISSWPLDTEMALLLKSLAEMGHAQSAIELIVGLEYLDFSAWAEKSSHPQETDLDKIFQQLNELEKFQNSVIKTTDQLRHILQKNGLDTFTDPPKHSLTTSLLKIYLKFFSEKLIQTRGSSQAGVSYSGRGVEYSKGSALTSQGSIKDYVIALVGRDKSDAVTEIQAGIGFSKDELAAEISPYLRKEEVISYVQEKNKFTKKIITRYGQFIFSESTATELGQKDVESHWKKFFSNNPETFLQQNISYCVLQEKLAFLKSKNAGSSFDFIDSFAVDLQKKLSEQLQSFEDLKSCEVDYYLNGILPQDILELLRELPDYLSNPVGKKFKINYTDPKAPLISAKIQDCFSWKKHPFIGNDLFRVTIELLAPNMRPAQVTNQIDLFWTSSYPEIRKELKARYPKHNWPEIP